MKKKTLKISAVVALIIIGSLLYGYYGFLYKSARDISSETSAFTVPAHGLAGEYAANVKTADAKYLNQAIEINGKVTEIRDSLVILDANVVCGFDALPADAAVNKNVTIKGRCIGFDELFGEVKLDQCTIKH
ncbi:hypothetical protein AMR72_11740 [Flavobacterium psychrophilum]|nr:hypothetical protein AMR72_11740 [Flavobacterium psychrophilum]AOE53129.1 hypothetical protein ALW18_11730 [Flavobacterium psychrophilum]